MPVTLTLTDDQVRVIRGDAVTALRVFGELFERLRKQERERFGFPPGEVDFNFAYPLELLQVCRRSIESIDAREADEATLICLIRALTRLGIIAVQLTDHASSASAQRRRLAKGYPEETRTQITAAWMTSEHKSLREFAREQSDLRDGVPTAETIRTWCKKLVRKKR